MKSPAHSSFITLRARKTRLWVAAALLACLGAACSYPGAVAPSTMPITGKYVELGGAEEFSSCGYTFLIIPISNPKPVASLIEDAIKGKGGDAMIQVSSGSSESPFARCVYVKGKVVKYTR